MLAIMTMNIDQVKALAELVNRIPRLEDFAMMGEKIESITLAPDGVVDEVVFPCGRLNLHCSGIRHYNADQSCYVLTLQEQVLGIFPEEETPF